MEETTIVPLTRVKYNGIFNFSDFYRVMYNVFTSLGYAVDETKYRLKEKQTGNEVEIIWDNIKKVDDYSRFKITVNIFIAGLRDVEIQKGNAKMGSNQADIDIMIKAVIQTDYMDRWETHPILKFLKAIYDRYLYKPTFETWKTRIYEDVYTTENEFKSFFNLARFM